MAKYPVYLDLSGKRAVTFGHSKFISDQLKLLHASGARIVAIDPSPGAEIEKLCAGMDIELVLSKYDKSYLYEATLVIADMVRPEVNEQILSDCRSLNILCCVFDQQHNSDFIIPHSIRRGNVQISVCAGPDCPALSSAVTHRIQKIFTPEHKQFQDAYKQAQKFIINEIADPAHQMAVLEHLASEESYGYFSDNGPLAWQQRVEKLFITPGKKNLHR